MAEKKPLSLNMTAEMTSERNYIKIEFELKQKSGSAEENEFMH